MKSLKSLQDFERLIKKEEPFVIYKHSPVCVVSSSACRNVEAAMGMIENANNVVYKVDVINEKHISQHIAEYANVKHESPQVLLFEKMENGQYSATEYVSHWLISTWYVQWIVNRALGKKSVDFWKKWSEK